MYVPRTSIGVSTNPYSLWHSDIYILYIPEALFLLLSKSCSPIPASNISSLYSFSYHCQYTSKYTPSRPYPTNTLRTILAEPYPLHSYLSEDPSLSIFSIIEACPSK